MKWVKIGIFFIVAFFSAILSLFIPASFVSAESNDTMIVEADIFADIISIEVPDYIFLGSLTNDGVSKKSRVDVNNTGTVAIRVTPYLKNGPDEIFDNLFFQNRQSGNNSIVYGIGEYGFSIDAPSSAGAKRSEYFRMWLNLTDSDLNLDEDLMGYENEIVFVALPEQ